MIVAALSLSLASMENAAAERKVTHKKKITVIDQPAAGAQSKRPGVAVPLTEQQCIGLGGKVLETLNSCGAIGKACYTTDVHGVIRHSCITE